MNIPVKIQHSHGTRACNRRVEGSGNFHMYLERSTMNPLQINCKFLHLFAPSPCRSHDIVSSTGFLNILVRLGLNTLSHCGSYNLRSAWFGGYSEPEAYQSPHTVYHQATYLINIYPSVWTFIYLTASAVCMITEVKLLPCYACSTLGLGS